MTDDAPPSLPRAATPAPRAAQLRPLSDDRRPDPNDPVVRYVMQTEGVSPLEAVEIIYLQGKASGISDVARTRFGARFATSKIARTGHLELFVIAPTLSDQAIMDDATRAADIEGWVRVLEFEPAWVAAWNELSTELERLDEVGVLSTGTASPGPGPRMPPYDVRLEAHALDEAIALHERFGALVELKVGFLAYPPDGVPHVRHTRQPETPFEDSPGVLTVELDRPVAVASGHTAHYELLLTNDTSDDLRFRTGSSVVADVTDPISGEVVGGYCGGQFAVGRHYSIPPGETKAIPLLVGTASHDPRLGYAVPPGEWSLRIVLTESRGRAPSAASPRDLLLPPVPIVITDGQAPPG